MTKPEKLAIVDAFERGGAAFDFVTGLEPALLTFRPFPEAWTIHEHVVHFLESDVAAFHRYRKAIAQPGGAVLGYDEEKWTPALDYHDHDLGSTLALIRLLRGYMAAHLRRIADRDWARIAYTHDSQGRVDLEKWIGIYADHARFHLELIERNVALWKAKKAS